MNRWSHSGSQYNLESTVTWPTSIPASPTWDRSICFTNTEHIIVLRIICETKQLYGTARQGCDSSLGWFMIYHIRFRFPRILECTRATKPRTACNVSSPVHESVVRSSLVSSAYRLILKIREIVIRMDEYMDEDVGIICMGHWVQAGRVCSRAP